MKKLLTYRLKTYTNQFRIGQEIIYIDPTKTFSCLCRVLAYEGEYAILEPLTEPKLL